RCGLSDGVAAVDLDEVRRAADERALVAAGAPGSRRGLEEPYRAPIGYGQDVGKVHGLCLRMTANREKAEDCTQETFIQAWRALPRFERRSEFGTWLHRIAVNTVLAQGRRRREELGLDAPVDDMLDTVADPSLGSPHG